MTFILLNLDFADELSMSGLVKFEQKRKFFNKIQLLTDNKVRRINIVTKDNEYKRPKNQKINIFARKLALTARTARRTLSLQQGV